MRGDVTDLSSVGMTIFWQYSAPLQPGLRITDIQLQLKSIRVSVAGIVMGQRADQQQGNTILVMFDPKSLDQAKKDKLHNYIQKVLQSAFDDQLARY